MNCTGSSRIRPCGNNEDRTDTNMAENKMTRMRELVELLNRARRAYEQEDQEIMSNYEYDRLYDELEGLEKELGTRLASSPTVNVGYEVLSELPKERHERPMLSLDKTKEVERLKEFLGDQKAMISWKLDGLTIVGATARSARSSPTMPGCLKMSPSPSLIRANWSCGARRSFHIRILRRSMRRSGMRTRSTRIPATSAAALCVS